MDGKSRGAFGSMTAMPVATTTIVHPGRSFEGSTYAGYDHAGCSLSQRRVWLALAAAFRRCWCWYQAIAVAAVQCSAGSTTSSS